MDETMIRDSLKSTIIHLNGQEGADRITAPFEQTISKLEKVYNELSSISRHRNTYNSNWAISHAFKEMHTLTEHLFSYEVSDKIEGYIKSFRNRKSKHDIQRKYEKINSVISELIRKNATSQKLYRTTVWIISVAEGVISLSIVLLITEFAAAFNRAVSLPQFSLLFMGVFGSLRLILERLKTRTLQNWRWKRYQESVDTAFTVIAKAAGISCILAHHIRQGTFLEEVDDILENGFTLMKEPPSKEERRIRRAGHSSQRLIAEQMEINEELEYKLLRKSGSSTHLLIPSEHKTQTQEIQTVPVKRNTGVLNFLKDKLPKL